ncbi:MAG TPA: hypothetical protein VM661_06900 [Candidatus Sulfotelmatobacter sp.]|nr:hypothetical protein [Candidatus Sulfotelmatobacter sp.]
MVKQSSFYVDGEVSEAIKTITSHLKKMGLNGTLNGAVRFSVLKVAREIAVNSPISP